MYELSVLRAAEKELIAPLLQHHPVPCQTSNDKRSHICIRTKRTYVLTLAQAWWWLLGRPPPPLHQREEQHKYARLLEQCLRKRR